MGLRVAYNASRTSALGPGLIAAGFKVAVSRAGTPFHPWVDSTYVSEPQFKVN